MRKLIQRLIREERNLAIIIANGSMWSIAVACWERQVSLWDFSLKIRL